MSIDKLDDPIRDELASLFSSGILRVVPNMTSDVAEKQRTCRHDSIGTPLGFVPLGWFGRRRVGWFSGRMVLWPEESTTLLSIVSSRLGREVEKKAAWFRALRAACRQAAESNSKLLHVPNTAAALYVERAAELFGVGLQRVVISESSDQFQLEDWLNVAERQSDDFLVSPALGTGANSSADCEAPIRDRLSTSLSKNVVALFVRSNGNLERLINLRLCQEQSQPAVEILRIQLAIGANLTNAATRDRLLSNGAVGWYLFSSRADDVANALSLVDKTQPKRSAEIGDHDHDCDASSNLQSQVAELLFSDTLIHCTRRANGAWPDESELERLDGLILSDTESDHSAFATLRHIIETQRLIGSDSVTRGPQPVVSFTAVTIRELRDLRVFRSHRGHWDFEPYGICIRRRKLIKLGARAVSYASDNDWKTMSESERPFFQLSHSVTKSGNLLDWTVEQEWRTVGDVNLAKISEKDAFVFVPSEAEATELRVISKWPVVTLSSVASWNPDT